MHELGHVVAGAALVGGEAPAFALIEKNVAACCHGACHGLVGRAWCESDAQEIIIQPAKCPLCLPLFLLGLFYCLVLKSTVMNANWKLHLLIYPNCCWYGLGGAGVGTL